MPSSLLSGSVNRRFHRENQTFLPEQHAKNKGFQRRPFSLPYPMHLFECAWIYGSINKFQTCLSPSRAFVGHLSFYFGKAASRRIDKCPTPGSRFSDKSSTASTDKITISPPMPGSMGRID